jgi:hypothetical protein
MDKEYYKISKSNYDAAVDALRIWERYNSKVKIIKNGQRPVLDNSISETIVCYKCRLNKNVSRRGVDSYDNKDQRIEIKGTVSDTGWVGMANWKYDYLYWARFDEHDLSKFTLYIFLQNTVKKSQGKKKSISLNLIKDKAISHRTYEL